MKVSLLLQQLDSTRHPRKGKGAVSGFKKYIHFLSLWIVLECTRGLYHAERKVPASQQPHWVNEQGRRVPPNGGKRRDAFVSICFLLSHRDSNSTELPQEGLRMYLVFDHTSSDGGGHYFCFHVRFLFCLWFFFLNLFFIIIIIVPAPSSEKNGARASMKSITQCEEKVLPQHPEQNPLSGGK